MTQRDRVLSMLGMAARAGKIESGEFSTEKTVKSGRGRLVIVAEDASGNTKRCLPICVNITKSPSWFLAQKRN